MKNKFGEMSFPWSVGALFSLEWIWEAKEATVTLDFLFFIYIFFCRCFGEQFSLTCSWLFYGFKKYIGLFICCNYNNIAIGVQLSNKSGHSFPLYTNN